MHFHNRRLAAAAYDRARETRRVTEDRIVFVGVELAPGMRRTLLGDVTLAGDPPEVLRAAVADALAMLRVAWIALLDADDDRTGPTLQAVHAALQCEVAAAEWTWSSATAEGHALGRTLARRCESLRQAIALPRPHGAGMLLPLRARASEPLPRALAEACAAVEGVAAGTDPVHGSLLREAAYSAVGAWRLREIEESAAALAIQACLRGDDPPPPAESEERVLLRAAS
jgi:hypothetical protein